MKFCFPSKERCFNFWNVHPFAPLNAMLCLPRKPHTYTQTKFCMWDVKNR